MRRFLPLVALLAMAGLPASAVASFNQESVLMDTDAIIKGNDAQTSAVVKQARDLGFTRLRVALAWARVAPGADAPFGPPQGFDPKNPASYPASAWRPYDRVLRLAGYYGLKAYININGFAPRWATPGQATSNAGGRAAARLDYIWKIDPKAWGDFVTAVGTRYSGTYPAEDGTGPLPQVDMWALYNEPGQGGWLAPQFEASPALGGKVIPASPHIYRQMVYSGYDALAATGHGKDQILLAELSPSGRERRDIQAPIRPYLFLREFFCLNSAMVPFSGAEASARGCPAQFRPIPGTGFAVHPYGLLLKPEQAPDNPEDISNAALGKFGAFLDKVAAMGRLGKNLSIWNTEYGWQTKPDPYVGIDLKLHAEYINRAEYLSWLNQRELSYSQYLLKDDPRRSDETDDRKAWGGWQSGLYFSNGKAKPALQAFMLPIVPIGNKQKAAIWGMVRPGNGQLRRALLQWRPLTARERAQLAAPQKPISPDAGQGGAKQSAVRWKTIGQPFSIIGRGYFVVPVKFMPGYWRFIWLNAPGGPRNSRQALVAPPKLPKRKPSSGNLGSGKPPPTG